MKIDLIHLVKHLRKDHGHHHHHHHHHHHQKTQILKTVHAMN